jgi:hypothetical protein
LRLLWTASGPCPDVHLYAQSVSGKRLCSSCGDNRGIPAHKSLGGWCVWERRFHSVSAGCVPARNSLEEGHSGNFAATARALGAYPHKILGGKGSSGTFEPPTRLNCDEALT